MTSKRYQIQQKLKPLYEIRTRISTQFRKAKEANDTDTIEIWERVWKAVANEIVALHDEADLMKIAKTEKLKLMKFEDQGLTLNRCYGTIKAYNTTTLKG